MAHAVHWSLGALISPLDAPPPCRGPIGPNAPLERMSVWPPCFSSFWCMTGCCVPFCTQTTGSPSRVLCFPPQTCVACLHTSLSVSGTIMKRTEAFPMTCLQVHSILEHLFSSWREVECRHLSFQTDLHWLQLDSSSGSTFRGRFNLW